MTLPDGTRTQVYYQARPGGQHTNGAQTVLVRLAHPAGWSLVLRSGILSTHKTRMALETCQTWHEVPLAIEALGVVG